jgi:hypothetical protein
MKCETPARSSRSSREPAPIQNPSETERTLGTFSEITRSPESSSVKTYFCTRESYRRKFSLLATSKEAMLAGTCSIRIARYTRALTRIDGLHPLGGAGIVVS